MEKIASLIELEKTASTNADALKESMNGAPHGTVIIAEQQTGGRGRRGNEWVSPKGNLYMSAILKPDCDIAEIGQISFVAAVALAECFETFGVKQPQTKWPNDILVDGRKISGILLETEAVAGGKPDCLIMGVGVNLISAPEGAVSLEELILDKISPKAFLSAFWVCFEEQYDIWLSQGFAPIRKAWLNHAYGLGEHIIVRLPGSELTGTFKGLDERGFLELEISDGHIQKISAGDVFFE